MKKKKINIKKHSNIGLEIVTKIINIQPYFRCPVKLCCCWTVDMRNEKMKRRDKVFGWCVSFDWIWHTIECRENYRLLLTRFELNSQRRENEQTKKPYWFESCWTEWHFVCERAAILYIKKHRKLPVFYSCLLTLNLP